MYGKSNKTRKNDHTPADYVVCGALATATLLNRHSELLFSRNSYFT